MFSCEHLKRLLLDQSKCILLALSTNWSNQRWLSIIWAISIYLQIFLCIKLYFFGTRETYEICSNKISHHSFKGPTKFSFSHYSCVVNILFSTGLLSLVFLPILLENWFIVFLHFLYFLLVLCRVPCNPHKFKVNQSAYIANRTYQFCWQ